MRRMRPVLQMEAIECGAACLAMVIDAHGGFVRLEEAREACGASRDGVDAVALITAAKSFGLDARPLARDLDTLADMPLPAIIHWRFNHFVILERVEGARYRLIDPAVGRRVVDRAEMNRSFTGLAVALTPGDGFEATGRRPSDIMALARHARGSSDGIALVFLCGLIGVIPAVALAGALHVFTEHVIVEQRLEWLVIVLLALVCAGVTQACLASLQALTVANFKAKIGSIVAAKGFRHALELPLDFFTKRDAGEIVGRLRAGAEIGATVAGPMARLAPNSVSLLALLGIIALYDSRIAAVVAVLALVDLVILYRMARYLAETNRVKQVIDGRASGIAASGFAAFDAFRLLGREALFRDRWMGAEEESLDIEQRLGRARALAELAPTATPLLFSIVVLIAGAEQVIAGALGLGGLLALQVLAGMVARPVTSIAADLCALQEASGALSRLDDLMQHEVDPLLRGDPVAAPALVSGAAALSLRGVGYGYGRERPLFSNIDLDIEPGCVVALTGPSGSGKSSLARILAGVVAPQAGRTLLLGTPLDRWPRALLRQRLAYVPQSSAIFTGSLAENVALFDADLDEAVIANALGLAGLGQLVHDRAGGLRAHLAAQAPALSGGEVQRLALARAFACQPAAMVLDETTSALDPMREAEILANCRRIGAAVLIVTHRMGTERRADRVLHLDGRGGLHEARPEPVQVTASPPAPQTTPERIIA